MQERIICVRDVIAGTMSANATRIHEFPFPVVVLGYKAHASNDSSATLAVSGGATIAATAVGDSGDPGYIQPTSVQQVAKDTAITLTIDYDGASGTAAENLEISGYYLVGEG